MMMISDHIIVIPINSQSHDEGLRSVSVRVYWGVP